MKYARQAAVIFALSLGTSFAVAENENVKQDNTARNKEHSAMKQTADQQSNREGDLEMTRKIRADIVANKNLSTYAHNIKIITRNGKVVLRGPVRSQNEKIEAENIARRVAGATSVQSEITIAR